MSVADLARFLNVTGMFSDVVLPPGERDDHTDHHYTFENGIIDVGV